MESLLTFFVLFCRFIGTYAFDKNYEMSMMRRCRWNQGTCRVSIPYYREPNSCKLKRRKSILASRNYYKLTRNGETRETQFPAFLQFLPVLNQNIDSVQFHAAIDPIESSWLAKFSLFYQLTADKWRNGLEKAFDTVPMSTSDQYTDVFDMHNVMLSALNLDIFSNPSLDTSTFTDIIHNQRYQTDDVFVQQRLAGPCPFLIRQVTKGGQVGMGWSELKKLLNKKYHYDFALQVAVNEVGLTLQQAVEEGRLYVLYHEENNDITTVPDYYNNGVDDNVLLNVTSPIAIFARTLDGELKIVAIQTDYRNNSEVYSPYSESSRWILAKAMVNLGDLNVCQAVWHLSHIHLSGGVYCTIYKSHLSALHPLHQILQHHCQGTTTHTGMSWPALIVPGYYGQQLFSISNHGYIKLTVAGRKKFKYGILDYDNLLRSRGLHSKKLKYHPFRDDGEIIWNGFKRFAKQFVSIFYKSDRNVQEDVELQSFARQISVDGGTGEMYGGKGDVNGFPDVFETKKDVATFITRFLWQIAMHGAVNYPVEPWATFIPLSPTKLYNDTRNERESVYAKFPDANTTIGAITFAEILGNLRINRIFDYYDKMEDLKLRRLVKKHYLYFNNCVQRLLERRNKRRKVKKQMGFQYFEPKWLTNSIHI